MKKAVLSVMVLALAGGSAFGADRKSRKDEALPPLPPLPSLPSANTPMWTGFYVGLNAGGAWSNNNTLNSGTTIAYQGAGSADVYSAALLSGARPSVSVGGFIGGGQVGYNWQAPVLSDAVVLGLEADIQGVAGASGNQSHWNVNNNAGLSYNNAVPYGIATNVQGSGSLGWLGTVRGRLGYLIMPTLMLYGSGGLAYGGYAGNLRLTQNWMDISGAGLNFLNFGASAYSNTMVGYAAGGGAEWMFMTNWSAKVEYLYYDLGAATGLLVNNAYGVDNATGVNAVESITRYSKRITGNIVRAGVNYHFNWGSTPVIVED
jgi:outer membrane immunogenic protein